MNYFTSRAKLFRSLSSIPSRIQKCSMTSRFSASLRNSLSGSCPGCIGFIMAAGLAMPTCWAIWLAAARYLEQAHKSYCYPFWIDLPLSLPRMNPNTDCKPIRLRKYQDRLDTHLTSRSRVITPDWSMDLKRIVKGKGSFTTTRLAHAIEYTKTSTYR